MFKKILALSNVQELSKKEQQSIHGGAPTYWCWSSIRDGLYLSQNDVSGNYGNGHLIYCVPEAVVTVKAPSN